MNFHESQSATAGHQSVLAAAPVASDRIRALAIRVMEGAPALTAGEMRELAEAVLDLDKLSESGSR